MRMIAALAAALLLTTAAPARAQDAAPQPAAPRAAAVSTAGSKAMLKLCRDWLFWDSCREYGRITLPERIAVGDAIILEFGSNPKEIRFVVQSIALRDGACRLLREGEREMPDAALDAPKDMIVVKPCTPLE